VGPLLRIGTAAWGPTGGEAPPIAASGSGSEDDVDLDRLREVLIKELGQSHRTCIVSNIAEIVPYSSEGAETLVKAIMANCMDLEKKRKQLLVATLQLPKEQAARMVEKVHEEERLRVLGAIVTLRAKLAKGASESASGIGPDATGSLGKVRYWGGAGQE
jgi:hypothetical protein